MMKFEITTAAAVREQLARLLADAMHVEVPSVEADLFETGVLDSLAFVELLVQLEREFGVTTSVVDMEIENFRSIARIAEFVVARGRMDPLSSRQVPSLRVISHGSPASFTED